MFTVIVLILQNATAIHRFSWEIFGYVWWSWKICEVMHKKKQKQYY